ncbi:hypothetical protein PENSPDRAFT_757725 [Peniophora sp. CONT]|nr:hypothetical protein PENSPDRAFT_757725 [Peniophora sp. CONT]
MSQVKRESPWEDALQFDPSKAHVAAKTLAQCLRDKLPFLTRVSSITGLRTKCQSIVDYQPKPVPVYFCGPTGAGKTTLINALLGVDVLPTSTSKSCTACPVEIGYHRRGTYEAQVEFMSLEEWRSNVMTVLWGARDPGEGLTSASDYTEAGTRDTFDAVSEVHPNILNLVNQARRPTADDIIKDLVGTVLGRTRRVELESAKGFLGDINKYVRAKCPHGDKDLASIGSLAPLVSKVSIRGNFPVLSEGLVFLDFPGVGDSNGYRSNLVHRHIQGAAYAFICIDSVRAQSNENAQILVRNVFPVTHQKQLQNMNLFTSGKPVLGFIVTKLEAFQDNTIRQELQVNVDVLEEQMERLTTQISDLKAGLETGLSLDSSDSIESSSLPLKRKASSSVGADARPDKLGRVEEDSDVTSGQASAALQLKTLKRIYNLEQEHKNLERERHSKFAQARAEAIRPDLLRMYAELGKAQAPTAQDVDRAAPPIFCVSSQDFIKFKADGELIKSRDVPQLRCREDTGFPSLLEHLQALTRDDHNRAVIEALFLLRQVCATILLTFDGPSNVVDHIDARQALRARVESDDMYPDGIAEFLRKKIELDVAGDARDAYCQMFEDQLHKSVNDGAAKASKWAMTLYEGVAETRSGAQPKKLLHWKRFVALLRHDGAHHDVDLNELLRGPMIDSMAQRWAETFDSDPLIDLRKDVQAHLLEFFNELLQSISEDLRGRVSGPVQATFRVSQASIEAAFQDAVASMAKAGRSVSRQVKADIEHELGPGYEIARNEFGQGHLRRIKDGFEAHLSDIKSNMFHNAAGNCMTSLSEAAEETGERLNAALTQTFTVIQKDLLDMSADPEDFGRARIESLRLAAQEANDEIERWIAAGREQGYIDGEDDLERTCV